ncbi:hypothetical protein Pan216_29210 [Planctomycetes bacterium Pan216]|uniref:Uncharacterized protein n=1 Tax=Kolteria novifilia TaxID=2527975 RepID=A0A518B501_9BACT|nr:hypothetical protein Pan216_29210 [Planctomycetes bacterium Pan216]
MALAGRILLILNFFFACACLGTSVMARVSRVDLKARGDAVRAVSQKLNQKKTEMQASVDALAKQLEETTKKVETASADNAKTIEQLNGEIERLRKQHVATADEGDMKQAQLLELLAKQGRAREVVRNLESDLATLQQENEVLDATRKTKRNELTQLQNYLSSASRRNELMQKRLTELKDKS